MSDLPAIYRPRPAGPPMPMLESARFRWLVAERPNLSRTMPTVEEEAALRRELRAALEPVGLDDLQLHVTRTVAAFPQRSNRDLRHYVLTLAETLAEYPEDAVSTAGREVVREFKFLPAVSEVVAICERVVRSRRAALRHLAKVAEIRQQQEEEAERTERIRQDRERWRRNEPLVKQRLADLRPDVGAEVAWGRLGFRIQLNLIQASDEGPDALDAALHALPMMAPTAGQ